MRQVSQAQPGVPLRATRPRPGSGHALSSLHSAGFTGPSPFSSSLPSSPHTRSSGSQRAGPTGSTGTCWRSWPPRGRLRRRLGPLGVGTSLSPPEPGSRGLRDSGALFPGAPPGCWVTRGLGTCAVSQPPPGRPPPPGLRGSALSSQPLKAKATTPLVSGAEQVETPTCHRPQMSGCQCSPPGTAAGRTAPFPGGSGLEKPRLPPTQAPPPTASWVPGRPQAGLSLQGRPQSHGNGVTRTGLGPAGMQLSARACRG